MSSSVAFDARIDSNRTHIEFVGKSPVFVVAHSYEETLNCGGCGGFESSSEAIMFPLNVSDGMRQSIGTLNSVSRIT